MVSDIEDDRGVEELIRLGAAIEQIPPFDCLPHPSGVGLTILGDWFYTANSLEHVDRQHLSKVLEGELSVRVDVITFKAWPSLQKMNPIDLFRQMQNMCQSSGGRMSLYRAAEELSVALGMKTDKQLKKILDL